MTPDPTYSTLTPIPIPAIAGGATAPYTAAIPISVFAGLINLFLNALATAGDTVRPWLVADGTIPAGNTTAQLNSAVTGSGGNMQRVLDVNGVALDLVGGGSSAQRAILDSQLTGFVVFQRIADSGAGTGVTVEIEGLNPGTPGARPTYGAQAAPANGQRTAAISTAGLPGYTVVAFNRVATGADVAGIYWCGPDVTAGAGAPAAALLLGTLTGGAGTAIVQIPPASQPGWLSIERSSGATAGLTFTLSTGGNSGADQGASGGGGGGGGAYVQNGNSFGARGKIGLNDNNPWDFETNGIVRATILGGAVASGFYGIGILAPTSRLHVVEQTAGTSIYVARFSGDGSVVIALAVENSDATSVSAALTLGGPALGSNNWSLLTDPASTGVQVLQIKDNLAAAPRLWIDALGRVAVGSLNAGATATPAVGAVLDVQSNSGGNPNVGALGLPVLTTTQETVWLALPPGRAGQTIWNSTLGFPRTWNGAAAVGLWITGGQSGGAALSLGTNDNFPLLFRANNANQFELLPGTSANSGPTCMPVGAGAGQTGRVLLQELVANGVNVTGFRAPDALAADVGPYTLPSTSGTAGQALTWNAADTLTWTTVPQSVGPIAAFGAATSLTTAVAQNVPPGSALLASSADLVLGTIMINAGGLTKIQVRFTGNVLNIAGQTITATLFKNGSAIAASAVAGIATTAGAQTGSLTYASQAFVAGDVISAQILPSGVLTAALTDVMISCG